MDIDHFKNINDTHGHASGDKVLQAIGELLATLARSTDVCARWGGEEFVILLPEADHQGGMQVAERTREAIEDLELYSDEGIRIPVTASLGVTTLRSSDSIDTFLDRADKAMYVAKTSGRNLVCSDLSPTPQCDPSPTPHQQDSVEPSERDTAPPTSEDDAPIPGSRQPVVKANAKLNEPPASPNTNEPQNDARSEVA